MKENSMMRAIEISSPGGPEVLQVCQRAIPALRAGEVLIKVRAAGINRPDVFQRKGSYPAPAGASDIPGLEVAGELVADRLLPWAIRFVRWLPVVVMLNIVRYPWPNACLFPQD